MATDEDYLNMNPSVPENILSNDEAYALLTLQEQTSHFLQDTIPICNPNENFAYISY